MQMHLAVFAQALQISADKFSRHQFAVAYVFTPHHSVRANYMWPKAVSCQAIVFCALIICVSWRNRQVEPGLVVW